MTEATVSAGYAKELLDFAVSKGAQLSVLLQRSCLCADVFEDPDNRIPYASYVTLMTTAKAQCNDPALPLHLGAATDFKDISVVGLICYASATMGEALMQLNRYGRLVAELDMPAAGERFQIVQRGEELWLDDTRSDPNSFPELTEETWSRFISETARHFPDAVLAKAAHVTHSKPAHSAEYDRIWKVPVTFNSDRNALLIEASWLAIELNQDNRYVFGVLSEHAEKLLDKLKQTNTLRGQVESALIPMLHTGDLSMERIAGQIGIGRQTLYRRLKAEGVSYETLLDELRHKMAVHYLHGKKVSVNETAYLVGFSDPSSFSRAFKRWTGSSPSRRTVH